MLEHARMLLDFLVFTVIVKMIVGHWIADQLVHLAKKWFETTDRKQAIWLHYQAQAMGNGHTNDDVLNCGQDHCQIFSNSLQLQQSAR